MEQTNSPILKYLLIAIAIVFGISIIGWLIGKFIKFLILIGVLLVIFWAYTYYKKHTEKPPTDNLS